MFPQQFFPFHNLPLSDPLSFPNIGKPNIKYIPQWFLNNGTDACVEQFENNVSSLKVGQEQILEKHSELSTQISLRVKQNPEGDTSNPQQILETRTAR